MNFFRTMNTRLEQLHEFLKEDPTDPFNIYALAIEYQKVDVLKAKAYFDELLLKHESYVPTYYHAGNLYLDLNLENDAIRIIEKGIQQAHKQNEQKAMRELQ